MSIDENNNEKDTANQNETDASPTEQHSADQSATNHVETAKDAAGSALANFLALKDSNPKVFFGVIGAAVLLLAFLFLGGGSNANLPIHQSKAVVIGQNYELKGANAYDQNATIRLVAVPGSMAAYDDTEENDREGGCKHIASGTPVKVVQSQDAYGKKDVFVEVEMLSGECEGKRGWALAINLQ